ncbi:hypothetical protein NC661_14165 [Aquibacillus koreensis]|uniref:Uncharacterized protein n=1 Tax=Aquibacillus koreensis TaxID=279446 RepID=A0A9X3WMU4_9BACI|nr:hypothetical protein [Aquibacillus koreensis]MCT2536726.1 hypothetical protein [Aquibacillus koreensis]MDC3421518.1 hypothetical protein [Aquibacillus koreensis]
MTNAKMVLFCTQINMKKWLVNPRIYTIFVLVFVFLLYHSYGLSTFSDEVGHGVSPWVFPHLITPPVLQVFAFFMVLLFCDAPFNDRHTPFVLIRTGRRNWIIGQILYIVFASAIFTIFTFITSIIVLIPNIQFSIDWGILIKSLASDPSIAPTTVTVFFNPGLLSTAPITATIGSIFHFFTVAVFIGVVILFFNLLFKQMMGVVVAGVFIALSFFVLYIGNIIFGFKIYYFSPVSWMSISYSGWSDSGSFPSPIYAISVLLLSIIMMSIVSVLIFCQKDMELKGGMS